MSGWLSARLWQQPGIMFAHWFARAWAGWTRLGWAEVIRARLCCGPLVTVCESLHQFSRTGLCHALLHHCSTLPPYYHISHFTAILPHITVYLDTTKHHTVPP